MLSRRLSHFTRSPRTSERHAQTAVRHRGWGLMIDGLASTRLSFGVLWFLL